MRKFLATVVAVVGGVAIVLGLAALWVQLLWNELAADLFSAPELGLVEALLVVGLIITVRLLTRHTTISLGAKRQG